MTPFDYTRAESVEDAIRAYASQDGSAFLGGGTNLVDLIRKYVEVPSHLVDVSALPLSAIEDLPDGGLRLGAMATNSATAAHARVREDYPVLSEAILAGASQQLRNKATNGGNLLQRTRCSYFNDLASPCNKRNPGSGCPALEGHNRTHAVLGTSDACIAAHPSDLCVALAALDATVQVVDSDGERSIPFTAFHVLPGETPWVETVLGRGDLIVAIDLPPPSALTRRSTYLKVRDRASYSFALVSVAAALDVRNGRIAGARVALGGVGTVPWRSTEAEQALRGAVPDEPTFSLAAQVALAEARPRTQNAYKVPMAERAIVRALSSLADPL